MKKFLLFMFYLIIGLLVGGAAFFAFFFVRVKTVEIPDLQGLNYTEAVKTLNELGLEVRVQGSGTVRRSYPTAGTKVRKGREVILSCEGVKRLTVPDLVGVRYNTVIKILQEKGFHVRIVQMPFKGTDGRVMGLFPPPGSLIEENGEISVLIDSGDPLKGWEMR